MTFPTLTFEVAFGVDPATTPTAGQWVDLSDRLESSPGMEWSYGRQSELDRIEAGTGSVRLANDDRELDPANEDSTYWPNVKPMVRCRMTATHNTVDYQVFEGFIESWTPVWPGGIFFGYVDVPIVDGFKLLSMARTSATYSEEPSGTRVGNLLDAAGWPAGARDLDAGQSDVQAYTASNRIVLSAIQDAAETEDGVFFIRPDGDAVFRDRYTRVVSTSQATFGDGTGELPYSDLVPSFNDTRIWNDITVTPDGLAEQSAEDTASQSSFGQRWLEKSTLHTTTAEADDFANWLIGRYGTPRLRADRVELEAHQDADVQTQVLSRQVGDRVTIMRRPPGGGDPIQLDVFIEQVSHRVSDRRWMTEWGLSPVFNETVWLAGTAGFSEAGQTTRAGY